MQVRLFGDAAIIDGASSLSLGAGRPDAVFAVLALRAGSTVSLDQLADAVWGDDQPGDPVHALRAAVSRLRNSMRSAELDDRVIEAVTGGYRLALSHDDVDLLEFDHLVDRAIDCDGNDDVVATAERAIDLWQGEPLLRFESFEFAVAPRRRLAERRVDLIQVWADAAIERGRAGRVVDLVSGAIDHDPFRERLWCSLALALYHDDRQADAIRSLQRAREALAEAGLDVSDDLADLENRILTRNITALRSSRPGARPLPAALDSFIGREPDLAALDEVAASARIVTVTGMGGIGKTRLALEFARRTDASPAFVDLAALDRPESIPGAIASAIGEELRDPSDLPTAVARWAGGRHALIILDNCEHMIEAVANVVVDIVGADDQLRVLATSREPLSVRAEHVVALDPLAIPDADDDLDVVDDTAATTLFLDRARAADRTLRVDAVNARVLRSIVRRLDGIPLAIELAAMRARTHSLEEIAALLDDALTALDIGRDVEPRHRTLAAAIQWSYDLLDPDEQRLLRRLGILVGPFDRSVAVELARRGEVSGEHHLAQLIDKSLVLRLPGSPRRLRLLEPIRQFALSRLRLDAEHDEVQRLRDGIFVEVAKRYLAQPVHGFADAREEVSVAAPNLDAAALSLVARGCVDEAAFVIAALATELEMGGRYSDARAVLSRCDGHRGELSRAATLAVLDAEMWTAVHAGDYGVAEAAASAALAIDPDLWRALNLVGTLRAERGDMTSAVDHLRRAIDVGPADAFPVRCNLAATLAWSGRLAECEVILDELEATTTEPGRRDFVSCLRGVRWRMAGDLDRAMQRFALTDRVTNGATYVAELMKCEIGLAAIESGDLDRAAQLIGELRADSGGGSTDIMLRTELIAAIAAAVTDELEPADLHAFAERALQEGLLGLVTEAADLGGWSLGDGVDHSRLVQRSTALRDQLGLARDPWLTTRLAHLHGDGGGPATTDRSELAADIVEALDSLSRG